MLLIARFFFYFFFFSESKQLSGIAVSKKKKKRHFKNWNKALEGVICNCKKPSTILSFTGMHSLLEAKADNFPLKSHVRSKAVLSCLVLSAVGENQGVY